MNKNVINPSFNTTSDDFTKSYEINLQLTAEQISEILDYRLGEKIEHKGNDLRGLLNTAECIKPANLSDEFCRHFISELQPLLSQVISHNSDSYEMTNFQHNMLRKFADCTKPKQSA